jgi:hypothetical protein
MFPSVVVLRRGEDASLLQAGRLHYIPTFTASLHRGGFVARRPMVEL